jgi:hypothetical protein
MPDSVRFRPFLLLAHRPAVADLAPILDPEHSLGELTHFLKSRRPERLKQVPEVTRKVEIDDFLPRMSHPGDLVAES